MPDTSKINNELDFQTHMENKTTEQKVDWLCWHIYQQNTLVCSKQLEHGKQLISLNSELPKLDKRITILESISNKPVIVSTLTGSGVGATVGSIIVWLMSYLGIVSIPS
jgi:phage tail protein X